MRKSSLFLHTAGIFLPTSSLSASSHPTVTWPHLFIFLVFGSREKLCKYQNILVLQLFFLLSHIHHGFTRKRWVKGVEVKRFAAVLIKLLLWNFSSNSVTNWDRIFPGFGDTRHSLNKNHLKDPFLSPPLELWADVWCHCSPFSILELLWVLQGAEEAVKSEAMRFCQVWNAISQKGWRTSFPRGRCAIALKVYKI